MPIETGKRAINTPTRTRRNCLPLPRIYPASAPTPSARRGLVLSTTRLTIENADRNRVSILSRDVTRPFAYARDHFRFESRRRGPMGLVSTVSESAAGEGGGGKRRLTGPFPGKRGGFGDATDREASGTNLARLIRFRKRKEKIAISRAISATHRVRLTRLRFPTELGEKKKLDVPARFRATV
jgi:hypothetical protein